MALIQLSKQQVYFSLACGVLVIAWLAVFATFISFSVSGEQAQVILTNAAALPAIVYALKVIIYDKEYSFVLECLAAVALMSFGIVYHMCDEGTFSEPPYGICFQTKCSKNGTVESCEISKLESRFEILQRASLEATYLMLPLAFVSLARLKPFIAKFLILGGSYVLVHFGFKDDRRVSSERFLFQFAAISIGVVALIWRIYTDVKRYQLKKNIDRISTQDFKELILHTIPIKTCLIPAIVLMIIAGISIFAIENQDNFFYVHSYLWQLPYFLAFFFVFRLSVEWNKNKDCILDDDEGIVGDKKSTL